MLDIDHLLALDTTDPASALEFRRGVGELAGYHTEQFKDGYWYLIDPAGQHQPFGNFGAEVSCWQHLPLFEMSADAALTLPLDDWHGYEITVMDNGRSYARVRDFHNYVEGDKTDFQEAKITALAVTRAWLRYRHAQSAPVATADEEA